MSSGYDNLTDFYALLGISPNASSEDIEAAYRRAAIYWHPDRNKSPNAAEMMRLVNEARAILNDPTERAAYDRNRDQGFRQQPGPSGSQRPRSSGGAPSTGGGGGRRPGSRSGQRDSAPRSNPLWIVVIGTLLVSLVVIAVKVQDSGGAASSRPAVSSSAAATASAVNSAAEAPTRPVPTAVRPSRPAVSSSAAATASAVNSAALIATATAVETANWVRSCIGEFGFRSGSTSNEVKAIQGTPTKIQDETNMLGTGYYTWHYGDSSVRIDQSTLTVTSYNNSGGNLEIRSRQSGAARAACAGRASRGN
jgi:hypothetical protein